MPHLLMRNKAVFALYGFCCSNFNLFHYTMLIFIGPYTGKQHRALYEAAGPPELGTGMDFNITLSVNLKISTIFVSIRRGYEKR